MSDAPRPININSINSINSIVAGAVQARELRRVWVSCGCSVIVLTSPSGAKGLRGSSAQQEVAQQADRHRHRHPCM